MREIDFSKLNKLKEKIKEDIRDLVYFIALFILMVGCLIISITQCFAPSVVLSSMGVGLTLFWVIVFSINFYKDKKEYFKERVYVFWEMREQTREIMEKTIEEMFTCIAIAETQKQIEKQKKETIKPKTKKAKAATTRKAEASSSARSRYSKK
jgi:hypothetical protein